MGAVRNAALFLGLATGIAATTGAQTTAPATPPPPSPQQQQMRDMMVYFQTHYTKHEYHIPMRDGVKLYTAVYTPIASQFKDQGPYPFLMSRTPYNCGPYGPDSITPKVTGNTDLIHSGYIFVCQDVRGRWASEGTWFEMTPSKDGKGIDESTDTYDTMEFLLKNVPG